MEKIIMALYDEYFRNEDKPFAENLNDALLLSNVFDLTVGIEMPKMFSNSEWVNTTSPRKCSVAICTLKEGLPSGVTVGTDSETGKSILSGTGTVKLSFYPNFNSFGSYDSISWENDGSIVVNLKTAAGTTIANNINKGDVESQSSELKTLQEIVIEIVFTNATLYSFNIVMSNKEQERYGATVGITDVTGLQDNLDLKVDKETGKQLSTNDFTNTYKALLDSIDNSITQIRVQGSGNPNGTFNRLKFGNVTIGYNFYFNSGQSGVIQSGGKLTVADEKGIVISEMIPIILYDYSHINFSSSDLSLIIENNVVKIKNNGTGTISSWNVRYNW